MAVLCAALRGACARVCAQMKRLCCCRGVRCPPARPPPPVAPPQPQPRPRPRPRKEQSVAERRGLTARVSGVEPPPPLAHPHPPPPPEAPERPALPSSSDLNGSPDAARFAPSHPFRHCSFTILNEPDELRRAHASGVSSAAELFCFSISLSELG